MDKLMLYFRCVHEKEDRIVCIDPDVSISEWLDSFGRSISSTCFQHLYLVEEKRLLTTTFYQERICHGDHLIAL